jgi:hypothetical protein
METGMKKDEHIILNKILKAEANFSISQNENKNGTKVEIFLPLLFL